MQGQLFRKKTLERISSPEQLQDYMRVTNPGTWMVLAAVIVLLVGLIAASALFSVENTIEARGTVSGEASAIVMELPLTDRDSVREGMAVRVAGQKGQPGRLGLRVQLGLQFVKLRAGQLGHVRVRKHFPRALDVVQQLAVGDGHVVQLAQLAVLAHELGKGGRVRDDLRQRNADGELLEAALYGFQLGGDARLLIEGCGWHGGAPFAENEE